MIKQFTTLFLFIFIAACADKNFPENAAVLPKKADFYALPVSVADLDVDELNLEIKNYLSIREIDGQFAQLFTNQDGVLYIRADALENKELQLAVQDYLSLPQVADSAISIKVEGGFQIPIDGGQAISGRLSNLSPELKNKTFVSILETNRLKPTIFAYNPEAKSAICHIRVPLQTGLPSLSLEQYMDERLKMMLSMSSHPGLAKLDATISATENQKLPFLSSELMIHQEGYQTYLDIRVGIIDDFYLGQNGYVTNSDLNRCLNLIATLPESQQHFLIGQYKKFTIENPSDILVSAKKITLSI